MTKKFKYSYGDPTKSSCKGCTKRKVGCHSKCKKYKEFRKELDKQVADNKNKIYGSTTQNWANYIPRKRGKR